MSKACEYILKKPGQFQRFRASRLTPEIHEPLPPPPMGFLAPQPGLEDYLAMGNRVRRWRLVDVVETPQRLIGYYEEVETP